MNPFVILGTQRTGTTLLATCLNNHPDVVCLGEVFKKFKPKSRVDVNDSGYLFYREATALRQVAHLLCRGWLIARYLDELYSRKGAAAVGFKLMFNHLRQSGAIRRYLQRQKPKAVNVYRRNVLKTLVSNEVARATGVYHATATVSHTKVILPIETLLPRLQRLEDEKECWVRLLGDSLPLIRVAYEDFVSHRSEESEKLLKFLGLRHHDLQSDLRKVNPDRLEDVIGNYDEVRAALTGTSFAQWLGEP